MGGCLVLVSNDSGWEEIFPSVADAEAALQIPVSAMKKCARTHSKTKTRLGTVEIDIQHKERMD